MPRTSNGAGHGQTSREHGPAGCLLDGQRPEAGRARQQRKRDIAFGVARELGDLGLVDPEGAGATTRCVGARQDEPAGARTGESTEVGGEAGDVAGAVQGDPAEYDLGAVVDQLRDRDEPQPGRKQQHRCVGHRVGGCQDLPPGRSVT